MKTKVTIFLMALFIGFNISFAQQDEECATNLSIFNEHAKNKKYDEAYEPWMLVRNKCPRYNRAIYVHGKKILEHKIANSTGSDKIAFINDLVLLKQQYNTNFASKYPKAKMLEETANLKYKYKKELNKSTADLYNEFDNIYNSEKENFKNPQALYTYYSLMVDLFDNKQKSAQNMFDKFDDVNEKIETEVAKASDKLNVILTKEEAGNELTKKEGKYKKFYEQTLKAYETITGSMDQATGERANCEVLIPLYEKSFDENKNSSVWLQRAMNRMYKKGCKDDPLFLKIVEQKNTIEPNADTAFYLYLLTNEQKYFDQTVDLESDPLKKSKLYNKLANTFKSKGSYGKARQYYMEGMKLNPANKKPWLQIASMYAKSANNCGDSAFNKRAVYWLAAQAARKGGSSKAAASYEGRAPSKSDIFSSGKAGQSIRIGCWIGRSVTVPSL